MKRFKSWILRIVVVLIACIMIALTIVLNPSLLYAHETKLENFTIYHHRPLHANTASIIREAKNLLSRSEIYHPTYKIDICLNDGSHYPQLIQAFHEPAFGIGFYNKVVIMGDIHPGKNFVELNGYKWNLIQLLTHEAIHCYQFNYFGLWKSNPLAGHATWKWEGYNEYVSRKNPDQIDLVKNVQRQLHVEKYDSGAWAIHFNDSTIAGRLYYKWWLQMQYCKDVLGMSYEEILKDTASEETIYKRMIDWYEAKNNERR